MLKNYSTLLLDQEKIHDLSEIRNSYIGLQGKRNSLVETAMDRINFHGQWSEIRSSIFCSLLQICLSLKAEKEGFFLQLDTTAKEKLKIDVEAVKDQVRAFLVKNIK